MKYLLIMLLAAVLLASCKKTGTSNANVLFYNATWSLPGITAAWNNSGIIVTPVAQGQTSGTNDKPYLPEPAGTNLLTLRTGVDTLINNNVYASSSGGNSFVLYNTDAVTGSIGIFQLIDDLTPTDTAQIKYRFIDLSPDSTAITDVWLVNGATDSIRLDSAASFIGLTGSASSIQSFTSIKYHGETYTIKMKKTGTEEVFAAVPGYIFTEKNAYSIVFSGLSAGAGNSGLKLSVLHNTTQ